MRRIRWAIALLIVLVAGWMVFDGIHALITGDFVTPESGEHAGQLGPWAVIIEAAGVSPRSTAVKIGFIVYGVVYSGFLAAFLLGWRRGWEGLTFCAFLGLFYLVAGTLLNAIILALLSLPAVRHESRLL